MKKVDRIEVKRAFVLSQRFTSKRMRTKSVRKNMIAPSEESLAKYLASEKKKVLNMSEKALDKIIADEYKKRLNAYNELEWFIGDVSTDDVKVWRGAGGLYNAWTEKCALSAISNKLKEELLKDFSKIKRVRAFQVVPKILSVKNILKKEKYLMPIVVPNGVYKKRKGRPRKIALMLDDGCMRSLAYAISGDKKIKVFIGKNVE